MWTTIFLALASCSQGFVMPSQPRVGRVLRSAAAVDEAMDIFKTKHGAAKPGTLFYVEDDNLNTTFFTLAEVYGEDTALEMTRRNPSCLAYKASNFAPTFKAFAAKFGDEDARAMVLRNPNLLAVPPTGHNSAENVKDDAMYFSYLIDATRDNGAILLPSFLFILTIPFIEIFSGIPFRANLLSSITGGAFP